jgi:hypothetical protein
MRYTTVVMIGCLSLGGAGERCAAQDRPASATPAASAELEVTNASSVTLVLYPARAKGSGLVGAAEQVTLAPGQAARFTLAAAWKGSGSIPFLPESAVRNGFAYPYGSVAFSAANTKVTITDESIPRPEGPLKKQAEPPKPGKPLVAYPHPLITEVLYAVPTGEAGDANRDGVRGTNGDEFIELVNPHDRPINLRGYTLSGKAPQGAAPGKKLAVLKFVFPSVELAPGDVVVVFNGHGAKWTTAVGDTTHAPPGPSDAFNGARVFDMKVESARLGFANKADYVLLTAPGGDPVHCIKWGEAQPPAGVGLVETAPDVTGQSVMRRTVDGALEPHPSIEGKKFSPGRFPLDRESPGKDTARPAR